MAQLAGRDVTKQLQLGDLFIDKRIKNSIQNDNLILLQNIRNRIDKAGEKLPTVEVRYKNLRVEADCKVIHGKPLPTLWNTLKDLLSEVAKLLGLNSKETRITIIDDVSGFIKPGRLTLLLGPPGCGKTTLLKALSGNLSKSLIVTGKISYNGYSLNEFIPQKTSAYISQSDLHIPEMTVRETIDFSACCQGVGSRADIMLEVSRKEKQAGVNPDPDIDTYMKAIAVEGQKTTLQTDYIMKILGLDICADTLVGDGMRRGISGGQKKRLTIGEMIVGPTQALFMDEISNGLDSSTTYQIIAYLQQLAHISDATVFVALLQPSPETFDLFDDIVLMSEGKIVYQGPCNQILDFFEDCGFRCPERKGVTDFLQEVLSRKDQAQYWHQTEQTYHYISVDTFCQKFKESSTGKNQFEELSIPIVMSASDRNAISFKKYSLSKWTLFKICMSREFLLMRRNAFVYVFKACQLVIVASVTMTVFLRTHMKVDALHANYFLGVLFFSLTILFFDGFPEFAITIARLPGFYKQRELYFFPAWAYAIPVTVLKVPLSFLVAFIWTSMTYYTIGYSPEADRFFRQVMILFAWHLAAQSLFRLVASVFRSEIASIAGGGFIMLLVFLFGGFIIPKTSMPIWLKWGFWMSPLSYAEIGLALNEFFSPRWQKGCLALRTWFLFQDMLPSNTTYGEITLESRGLHYSENLYWISLGALFGFTVIFSIGFTLALTFLDPPGSRAIISSEGISKIVQESKDSWRGSHVETKSRVGLPFEPLTIVFKDVQYSIDTPSAMRERGFPRKKLKLLNEITGAFRPGVLTALMGVSGAGKTTLLDVLAGRKTSGIIEGEIKIGGFPKIQETFARISGYCEQNDIHSPQITVEESLFFSAWLRLNPQIDSKTKYEFVKEVLETVELENIKDSLVGLPGLSGLTSEQRKRLTIAVELVSNPSIIFMDEPTTGLDARAAAIVMRAVKNVSDTGRTIVCTIHQPSIDIFEAFDELMLLKDGGQIIYSGPLGHNSSSVIKYFVDIPGVPDIKGNYNPATWMLEVTSTSAEAELGVDFVQVYRNSSLYRNNQELVNSLSVQPPGSKELHFSSQYSQNGWGQFKCCLWKQNLSYWRSPSYNLLRLGSLVLASLIFGLLFWNQGTKIHNQQSLFTIFGSMFAAVTPLGINNCSSVGSYISTERTVLYREKFAGMYSTWAYALAQVIVEVPYLLAQVLVFMMIVYPMIGYYWTVYKVLWFFYIALCTALCYTYLGMLIIAITPSFPVAASLQSAIYTALDLFSGFVVPRPQLPKWWLWLYYVSPMSWILNALLTSQYGDIHKEISVFGETKTVTDFIKDYFGFRHEQLPLVGFLLVLYPIVFAFLFAYFIGKLNFQRR